MIAYYNVSFLVSVNVVAFKLHARSLTAAEIDGPETVCMQQTAHKPLSLRALWSMKRHGISTSQVLMWFNYDRAF